MAAVALALMSRVATHVPVTLAGQVSVVKSTLMNAAARTSSLVVPSSPARTVDGVRTVTEASPAFARRNGLVLHAQVGLL